MDCSSRRGQGQGHGSRCKDYVQLYARRSASRCFDVSDGREHLTRHCKLVVGLPEPPESRLQPGMAAPQAVLSFARMKGLLSFFVIFSAWAADPRAPITDPAAARAFKNKFSAMAD